MHVFAQLFYNTRIKNYDRKYVWLNKTERINVGTHRTAHLSCCSVRLYERCTVLSVPMFFQFYLTSSMHLRRTKYVCMHCKLEISAGSGSWQYTRALFGFRSSSGRFILNSIGVGSSLVGAIGAQRPDLDKYFGIGLHICFILKKSSKKLFLFSLFFSYTDISWTRRTGWAMHKKAESRKTHRLRRVATSRETSS